MNSDGLAPAGELDAIAQRHEGVVGAGHEHAVFAGLFDLVAQHLRELEDDGLLHLPARRPGAVVDAAVAGIDHHERARIAVRLGVRGRLRLALRRPALERDGAHERLAVAGREVDHEARGLIVGGVDHERLVDPRRTRQIDDDARAALHDEAEAECLDQAAPRLPGLGRETERDLRHVHHHPVRVGERERPHVDLLAQIDRPCASANRRRRAAPRSPPAHHSTLEPAGRLCRDARPRTRRREPSRRREKPSSSREQTWFSSPASSFYSITGARLTQT